MNPLNLLTAQLASMLRLTKGTLLRRGLARDTQPDELLILYSFEGCPFCRMARERLVELDLDYIHKSAPKGSTRVRDELRERTGKAQFPYLIDPNTGAEMFEAKDILAYLEATYG